MNAEPTVSLTWLLRLARRGFGAWMVIYGVAAFFSPNERLPVSALNDVSQAVSVQPHHLISLIFLIPGIPILIDRTHGLGLFLAATLLFVFEIGLLISGWEGTGTYTAPVTFGFSVAIAGLLFSLKDVK